MNWTGDQAKIQQLCQMFEAASNPNTQIQQQIMQALAQFSQMPDFNMYLVAIFVQIPNVPVDVRQRSGLLLKTNVSALPKNGVQPPVAEHINTQALAAMKDQSKAIRHTAGTILTTMVKKMGFSACNNTLQQLVETVGTQNQSEALEGCLSAIGKICEDGVAMLASFDRRGTDPTVAQEAQLFVAWSNQQVLPRMLQLASPSSPAFVKQCALQCLNFFALGGAFIDDKFGMQKHTGPYIEALGTLANDTSPEVLQPVCKGFACIVEDGWSCLTMQHYQVILQFMLKASQNSEYGVRLEALAVWIACASQPDSWGVCQKLLPELVPVLITNMVYTDADYMILEPSQTENDNANVADDLNSIKPRFHMEANNIDGDEDDSEKVERSSHGWGAEWTARKAAAKSLDELSSVFPEVMQHVLPQIEQKLNHASWEHQEAGVLALGAIGVHTQDKLAQFLPAVIGLLLKLCDAQMPLLRSISCWCVARFRQWIFHQSNANREQVTKSVLMVILPRCLDRNKRVQEASISALLSLTEGGQAQLVPYLDDIVQTLTKAFQLYQLNNQRILYDTVGALAWAVGAQLEKPQYMQALVSPIFQKFDTVPDHDIMALPIFECVANLFQVLGRSLAPALQRVAMRGIKSINDTALAAQMWEQNPSEYERPQNDIMASSCDLFSGILEGFKEQSKEIAAQLGLFSVVTLALRSKAARVQISGFWLLGVGTIHCMELLMPLLPELMPFCVAALAPTMSLTVSTNASWAIGEVCQKAPPESLTPYLSALVPALVGIVQRVQKGEVRQWQMRGHNELLQNVCTTLNHLRQRSSLCQQWAAVLAQLPEDVRRKFQP